MQISSLLSAIPGPYDFNCSLNTVLRAVSEQCSDTALRTAQYVTMSLTHSHFDFGTHREILDTLENAFKEQSLKQWQIHFENNFKDKTQNTKNKNTKDKRQIHLENTLKGWFLRMKKFREHSQMPISEKLLKLQLRSSKHDNHSDLTIKRVNGQWTTFGILAMFDIYMFIFWIKQRKGCVCLLLSRPSVTLIFLASIILYIKVDFRQNARVGNRVNETRSKPTQSHLIMNNS